MTIVEMIFTQPRSHRSGRERERGAGLGEGGLWGLQGLSSTVILLLLVPFLLSVGISLVFYSFKWLC